MHILNLFDSFNLMLQYWQVFLTLCTLVTLYFADEVPLITASKHHQLSDSAPLLDEQNGIEFPKQKPLSVINESNGKLSEDRSEEVVNLKHESFNAGEDHNENLMDGPGAVLVNLLTSLRHLPPAMHSVLVVMALTWVGTRYFITYVQKIILTSRLFSVFTLLVNLLVLSCAGASHLRSFLYFLQPCLPAVVMVSLLFVRYGLDGKRSLSWGSKRDHFGSRSL